MPVCIVNDDHGLFAVFMLADVKTVCFSFAVVINSGSDFLPCIKS